ncbi:MAG: flagellar basal body P-ring protein FlgI, partial [Rhodothermales bacterium]
AISADLAPATVSHAGRIQVDVAAVDGGANAFLAAMEELNVAVDVPARVVINERTGTIVAGGGIRVNEVMVTYGSIVISTQEDPFVSQPPALSGGETITGTIGSAGIEEETARSVVLPPNTDVGQLATALNELGLTSRDVIAIFQAIDRAGALQGELIIL